MTTSTHTTEDEKWGMDGRVVVIEGQRYRLALQDVSGYDPEWEGSPEAPQPDGGWHPDEYELAGCCGVCNPRPCGEAGGQPHCAHHWRDEAGHTFRCPGWRGWCEGA